MKDTKYWDLLNIERSLGSSWAESLYNIARVIKIKESLNGKMPKNLDELLNMVYRLEIDLPPFHGDERLFFALYERIVELSNRELIDYARLLMESDRYHDGALIKGGLSKLMFSSMQKTYQEVLVCDVEKYGAELYDFVLSNKAKYYFTVRDKELKIVYQLLYKNLNIEFVNSDIYEYGFINKKFDLILCFPIMGARQLAEKNSSDFISREYSFIAAQNLLYHLTQEGKLIIILPAKIGFGVGDAEILRNYIQMNYKVNEIASLPTKIFYPYMSISTYYLSLSQGITEDICVKKYELTNDSLVESDSRLIFLDELENLNAWNVDMVFAFTDESLLEYHTSAVKKSQLIQVADVFRGKAITQKDEDGDIAVINISDISDTGINYSNLDTVKDDERKILKYLLQDGDVLIATKGFAIKVAVFEKQNRMCIASSNLCVIRSNKKLINGTYLKLFLESDVGMKLLKSLQRGSTIVNINFQDICQLEVPTPALDEQFDIANEYETGLKLYKETIKSAEDAWKKIKASVQSKLF